VFLQLKLYLSRIEGEELIEWFEDTVANSKSLEIVERRQIDSDILGSSAIQHIRQEEQVLKKKSEHQQTN